ncbi:RNA polymerase I-specific transcription initiation factor RRN3-like isoform X2 [Orbicella faveolata]|uniref:RNA polymerase I-specific transcription initiation factor RRN3-like isoform X2 n=2 Tax=Orbicella faveolata TaxID=48498 RepID=UPI0009E62CD7|nr:RNA polymerase I-specific transcription initiation factor RRN3-like isoform X2 [Orbicella faveolata]
MMSGETSESRAAHGPAVLVSLVLNALQNAKQGNTKDYDMLIQKLADPDIKEMHLQRYLMALTSCSASLTKQYDTLVGTALNTRWAVCGDKTVEEFIEFLTSLVSAQTYYLRACLRMIVKLFLPGVSKDGHLKTGDSEDLDKVFCHAHEALQAVLEVVPAVPQFLIPVLSENFPYMKKPTIFQASYVKNLLQITKYLPDLRSKILELVIHNLITIDVEIPKHELEHNEAAIEEDHTQFEVDMDEANIAVEASANHDEEICMENEMADKLDILMEILFKYIHEVTHINGEHSVDAGTELFNELLLVFENVILPTHASCHVQYVMFQVCSFDLDFANSLLDVCWKKIEDPNTPSILRQACAAYIASFIARAKYIPISTVQTCLDLVAHWIHCYIDMNDAGCLGPDVSRYGPFYSVCQALFYMFIFRHKQLLDLEEGLKYLRRLNLDRIVTCRMNPLKVCLPTVVKMFAHITRQHELVFCYTIIEQNNRMMLPVATPTSSRAVLNLSFMNQLDSFFPFDPYLLRRSSKFIKSCYQEWEGIEEDEVDEDEKKHSEGEDEAEEYLEYSRSPDATVPGFTPDTPMCVSPGFISSPITHLTVQVNAVNRSRR